MANLEPVIRYQKYQLDEKRRFIARLFAEAEKVYNHKARMLDEVKNERSFVDQSEDPRVITGFLTYQNQMKKRVALINVEIGRIDARIGVAQDDLRESFTELKKFEIIQRNRLARMRRDLERKEAQIFDAIAIEGFHRAREDAEAEERMQLELENAED